MSDILNKVRKLNWLLQESPTGAFSFNEMCGVLSDLMDSDQAAERLKVWMES